MRSLVSLLNYSRMGVDDLQIRRMSSIRRNNTNFNLVDQNVAEHTAMLQLYITSHYKNMKFLFPNIKDDLKKIYGIEEVHNLVVIPLVCQLAMVHDIDEIFTGDEPHPWKALKYKVMGGLGVKDICEKEVKKLLYERLGKVFKSEDILNLYIKYNEMGSDSEVKKFIKIIDMYDYLMSRIQDYLMGNKLAIRHMVMAAERVVHMVREVGKKAELYYRSNRMPMDDDDDEEEEPIDLSICNIFSLAVEIAESKEHYNGIHDEVNDLAVRSWNEDFYGC